MIRPQIFPALLVAFSLVGQEAPKAPEVPKPAATRLTLQAAIETSLKNNLQVQIAAETRDFTKASEYLALGVFDLTLNSALNLNHSKSSFDKPPFQGSPSVSGTSTFDGRTFSLGVIKPFDWGGTFQASYNPSYSSSTTNILTSTTTTNPYTGTLGASYTQSLLRGFGRNVTGASVIVARLGTQAADYSYQAAIINLVATTESAYWDVVFAERNLENKRQALDLATKQLNENRIRVQVGTMAPLDVTNAEAAAAQAEQNIIAAEATLNIARDTLIRTLFPNAERPGSLELSDAPNLSHTVINEEAAIKQALERRVELKSAKLDLQSRNVLEGAANNRLLPQLDLSLGYNGSASNYDRLSPVNSDLTGAKNPGYSVGLQFSLPIQNRGARGSLYQARANRRSSELTLHDQELGITLEVRSAIWTIDAAEKGVKAAEKTRYFREKDLEAERKKFENGMSTNFLVLSKMTDLDTAKSAEVQAQITYAKSVTALEKAIGNLLEARNLKIQ